MLLPIFLYGSGDPTGQWARLEMIAALEDLAIDLLVFDYTIAVTDAFGVQNFDSLKQIISFEVRKIQERRLTYIPDRFRGTGFSSVYCSMDAQLLGFLKTVYDLQLARAVAEERSYLKNGQRFRLVIFSASVSATGHIDRHDTFVLVLGAEAQQFARPS